MLTKHPIPCTGRGYFINYEIRLEVDIYRLPNTPCINMWISLQKNRGSEGKAHNLGFAGTIHIVRTTPDSQVTYKLTTKR